MKIFLALTILVSISACKSRTGSSLNNAEELVAASDLTKYDDQVVILSLIKGLNSENKSSRETSAQEIQRALKEAKTDIVYDQLLFCSEGNKELQVELKKICTSLIEAIPTEFILRRRYSVLQTNFNQGKQSLPLQSDFEFGNLWFEKLKKAKGSGELKTKIPKLEEADLAVLNINLEVIKLEAQDIKSKNDAINELGGLPKVGENINNPSIEKVFEIIKNPGLNSAKISELTESLLEAGKLRSQLNIDIAKLLGFSDAAIGEKGDGYLTTVSYKDTEKTFMFFGSRFAVTGENSVSVNPSAYYKFLEKYMPVSTIKDYMLNAAETEAGGLVKPIDLFGVIEFNYSKEKTVSYFSSADNILSRLIKHLKADPLLKARKNVTESVDIVERQYDLSPLYFTGRIFAPQLFTTGANAFEVK